MREGTLDASDFVMAEQLHLTLGQLYELPNLEYLAWRAYFVWKASEMEFKKDKAHGKR